MDDCVFCKIVKGELDSEKVYEDDLVLAFLDIKKVSEEHTLIIPKKHYENIYDIPDKELQRIILITKKLAKKYKQEKGINQINLLNSNGKEAQQSVFHFHMHLVPRQKNDKLNLWFSDES